MSLIERPKQQRIYQNILKCTAAHSTRAISAWERRRRKTCPMAASGWTTAAGWMKLPDVSRAAAWESPIGHNGLENKEAIWREGQKRYRLMQSEKDRRKEWGREESGVLAWRRREVVVWSREEKCRRAARAAAAAAVMGSRVWVCGKPGRWMTDDLMNRTAGNDVSRACSFRAPADCSWRSMWCHH